jgi:hypothetical protein
VSGGVELWLVVVLLLYGEDGGPVYSTPKSSPWPYEVKYLSSWDGIPIRAVSKREGALLSLRRLWMEDMVYGLLAASSQDKKLLLYL